ncbi:hypothetical protein RRF57_001065 [Xylaria bambusicola]|uniref:Metallo-beta-lactamase domain-containing protein n=1 Tax=Xylaria bambusicola TaxID=326684 RepID=A0AAN7UFV1_9PEZI
METPSAAPPQSESRQEVGTASPANKASTPTTLHISDKAALAAAWSGPHPIITHLNADTTWVLHLPSPEGVERPSGRRRFNVLLDPWLQGPQSDGGRWFSIQWHVVAPSVQTIKELNGLLAELEKDSAPADTAAEMDSYIDVVAISHEFTDHCHEATLRELPSRTPIFAPDKAAKLIRSWKHFDAVTEMPPFVAAETKDWRKTLTCVPLPPWLGIGRVVTPGNSLYYHSAILIAWAGSSAREESNCVIYSPHGIEPNALSGMKGTGLQTLALLHGLDDVRLWMMKQLNLGAVNGVSAARKCGAKYWVATHDEVKKGGGFVSLLLRRTTWSVADAVKREGEKGPVKEPGGDDQAGGYEFVELGSGDGLVLA